MVKKCLYINLIFYLCRCKDYLILGDNLYDCKRENLILAHEMEKIGRKCEGRNIIFLIRCVVTACCLAIYYSLQD